MTTDLETMVGPFSIAVGFATVCTITQVQRQQSHALGLRAGRENLRSGSTR
jgi:hypothetical protein